MRGDLRWMVVALGVLAAVAGAGRCVAAEMVAERFLGREFFAADLPVWDGDPIPYTEGPSVVLINPNVDEVTVDVRFENGSPALRPVVPGGQTVVVPLGRLATQPDKTCSLAPCPRVIPTGSTPSPAFRLSVNTLLTFDPNATFAAALLNPARDAHRSDMTFLIPTCSLGTTHRVGSYVNQQPPGASCNRPANSGDSWIAVVAAEATTSVAIFDDTPVPNTLVHSQLLGNAGDYLLWNAGSDPLTGDVTGYRVETDPPAAVYSGSDCTAVGLPALECNSLVEAVMPERVFADTGSMYVALPTQVRPFAGSVPCTGPGCTPDTFRFIAHARLRLRTTPVVAGCNNVVLDAGEFAECFWNEPFLVHSHVEATDAWPGPTFQGYQYLASQHALWSPLLMPGMPPALRSAGVGDPAMVSVMPLSTWACHATAVVPPGFDGDKLHIHVVRPQGGLLEVDGVPVASACTPVPTPTLNVYGISPCVEHVALTAAPGTAIDLFSPSGPMTVMATGFGPYDAFAWNVPGHELDNASPYTVTCPGDATYPCGTVYMPPSPPIAFRCGPFGDLVPATSRIVTADDDDWEDLPVSDCPKVRRTPWTLTIGSCAPLQCQFNAFAEDSVPPSLVGVPADVSVSCEAVPSPATVTAADACDPAPTVTMSETTIPGPCPSSYTLVRTWIARDRCNNPSLPASQTIVVTDTTPPFIDPDLNQRAEACLKQANHKYFCYEDFSSRWSASDTCCAATPTWVVTCTSDEPENGTGDGNTIEDCVYDIDNDVLCVRAERRGNRRDADREHPGRTYTVTVVATDCCGNSSAPATVFRVYVPHDFRMNPVDDDGTPIPCDKPVGPGCCAIGSN